MRIRYTLSCLTVLFIFLSNQQAGAQSGCLAAHYKLDASAVDNGGKTLNGTLNGTKSAKDRINRPNTAISLNGTSDYVRLGSAFDYKEKSISMWVYIDTFTALGSLYACDNPNLVYGMTGITAFVDSGKNKIRFGIGADRIDSKVKLNTRTWYHLALVFNQNFLKCFVNGQMQDSIKYSGSTLKSSDGDAYARLGSSRRSTYFQKCTIDELKIFNCAISNDEVKALYTQSECMMAWLYLNGNGRDSSSNKRHATVYGASATTDRYGKSNSALLFNGTSNYVTLGTAFDYPERSLSLWFNADTFPTSAGAIYASDNASLKYGMTGITAVNQSGVNKIQITVGSNTRYFDNNVKKNVWYQVGIVVSNTYVKYFVNGQMFDSLANNSFLNSGDGDLVAHLGSHRKNGFHFKGKIDDFRVSECPWTNQEMYAIYRNAFQYDAGISAFATPADQFCAGTDSVVKVTVRNYGLKALDSLNVGWSVNGKVQKPLKITTRIASDSSITITAGTFRFGHGTHTLKAWTSLTSGLKDSAMSNDTLLSKITTSPITDAGPNRTMCSNDSAFIGLNNRTGNTYEWSSNPSGFSSKKALLFVKPAKTTVYYLRETSSKNGCSNTDSVVVVVNPQPKAVTGSDTSVCMGSSVALGAARVPKNDYTWTSYPSGFNSKLSNPVVQPTQTTIYELTEVDSVTGCMNSGSVEITVNPLPNAVTGSSTTVCAGTQINLGASGSKGNTYVWWSKPSGFNATISNPGPVVSVSTTYYLKETIIATGCTKTDSVKINVLPVPDAYVARDTALCLGESVRIGGAPVTGNNYAWTSNPSGFSNNTSNPLVTPGKSIVYTLTETITATGCKTSRSVVVTVNNKPNATVGTDQTICRETKIIIGASEVIGNKYSWTSNPSGFQSNASDPAVSPQVKTVYRLTETDPATGCYRTDSVTISVLPLPAAKVGRDTTLCMGESAFIGGGTVSGNTYSWTSDPAGFTSISSNPKVTPKVKTVYHLTETIKSTGCFKKDYVTVDVLSLPESRFTATASGKVVAYKVRDSALAKTAYVWDLGDGNGATGYHVKHVYAKNMTYTARLQVKGDNGCVGQYDSSVAVLVSSTGKYKNSGLGFRVYPNPVHEGMHIVSTTSEIQAVEMYSSSGQLVYSLKSGEKQRNVYISRQWPAGMYFIKITNPEGFTEIHKLVLD